VMFVLAAGLAAALTVAPAHAQSGVSADVPFNFALGKTTLDAGHYRVEKSGASFLTLTGASGKTQFTMRLPGGHFSKGDGQPYLVFTRYGEQAFLSKVVFSAKEVYDLPLSSREKEMKAHLLTGEQVALLVEMAR